MTIAVLTTSFLNGFSRLWADSLSARNHQQSEIYMYYLPTSACASHIVPHMRWPLGQMNFYRKILRRAGRFANRLQSTTSPRVRTLIAMLSNDVRAKHFKSRRGLIPREH